MISSSGGSGSNYSGSEVPVPPSPGGALGVSRSTFTYEQLVLATDGFSDANLLGQGGFGYVHRGVLPNGKEVAVKQLKTGSGQGEREFQAEVDIISRVHHKHLVSLVGYCMSGGKRLLVYEYVPNNTLEFHLHGHPKIIHRDIKATNILLDYKFEPKHNSNRVVFGVDAKCPMQKAFEFEVFVSSHGSSDYDSGQYNEDMKKFRKMALTPEYGSSDYSAPTSEYGQHPSASASSEGQHTQEIEMEKKKDGYDFGSSL
ncbi:hypothetical protein B296_00056364 [Ensete ventricosum]|uniref:non-specific serine/threonine protein kinase n=1 Tax=Ensete ventricosum TaxID=4639 RepID=A0A426XVK6_ENSVE|nr:hypothetical protein B296_00056364 [Ensete ventricosum]